MVHDFFDVASVLPRAGRLGPLARKWEAYARKKAYCENGQSYQPVAFEWRRVTGIAQRSSAAYGSARTWPTNDVFLSD